MPDSGTILSVYAPYTNENTTKTDGIDIDARTQWTDADLGRFTLGINWTHIFSFKRTLGDGTTSEFAGSHGPTELSSSAGTPKDRGVLGFGWDRGPWSATTWLRYTGPMQDIEFIGDENGCLHIDYQVGCHISSFTTVDVSGSYKGFKNWEIYGSINNLFNRKAPFDYQAGYGLPFYNTNYAFVGRRRHLLHRSACATR